MLFLTLDPLADRFAIIHDGTNQPAVEPLVFPAVLFINEQCCRGCRICGVGFSIEASPVQSQLHAIGPVKNSHALSAVLHDEREPVALPFILAAHRSDNRSRESLNHHFSSSYINVSESLRRSVYLCGVSGGLTLRAFLRVQRVLSPAVHAVRPFNDRLGEIAPRCTVIVHDRKVNAPCGANVDDRNHCGRQSGGIHHQMDIAAAVLLQFPCGHTGHSVKICRIKCILKDALINRHIVTACTQAIVDLLSAVVIVILDLHGFSFLSYSLRSFTPLRWCVPFFLFLAEDNHNLYQKNFFCNIFFNILKKAPILGAFGGILFSFGN